MKNNFKHLEYIRWTNGLHCPKCRAKNAIKRGFQRKSLLRRYTSKNCGTTS